MGTYLHINVYGVNIGVMTTVPYHHGNLMADLLTTGLQLVRQDGASALIARGLARELGVTPAAIYRHFTTLDHLRAEVSRLAREELARAQIKARMRVTGGINISLRRFEAVGKAYIQFALDEPGYFDVAFIRCGVVASAPDNPSTWNVLNDALDELVADGVISKEARTSAPIIAWSAVHGLSTLLLKEMIPDHNANRNSIRDVMAGIRKALSSN